MAKASRNLNARRAYEFIKAHRREYPIETMCRVLKVAPSGYHDWLLYSPAPRSSIRLPATFLFRVE
jgi:hypothetical protein